MAHGIQLPGSPQAKGAIKNRIVHVEHLVLNKAQIVLVQLTSPVKPHANIKGVARLVFNLL